VNVAALGERALLARIRTRLGSAAGPHEGLVLGIGDDAAVVRPGRNGLTVLTVDAQVEGVHFEWGLSAPADIGARALAVNLSDLAAMGARPRWALVSLMLPGTLAVGDVEDLIGGLAELALRYGVAVVGGNVAQTPGPAVVDVTAVGDGRPRRLLKRSGARPGDELLVSGEIGGAAAGLAMLRAGRSDVAPECVRRYRRPEPRIRLGQAVGHARSARAAMDLSDGLADAAHQIADASGCGVEIDAGALPIARGARTWWASRGEDPVIAALGGGDDYELLFAVPPSWRGRLRAVRQRVADPPLTRVGVLTKDPGVCVLTREGRREQLPGGYEHFQGSRPTGGGNHRK
jgi:thiamine-monophosphate kinase